jgi:hypothetical protein
VSGSVDRLSPHPVSRASRAAIDANAAVVHTFTRAVLFLVRHGLHELGAHYARTAAEYAWHNHPGYFASPVLESALARISEEVVSPPAHHPQRLARPGNRVLHVISVAGATGGHTRLAWRWMSLDATHSHSVALTRQRDAVVPLELTRAVGRSGGAVYHLDLATTGYLSPARRLAQLAYEFEYVVLHTHPDDPIPILAFAARNDRPPTLYQNHADHVFWLGRTISDLTINFRQSGALLSTTRRGIPPAKQAVLPIPLTLCTSTITRQQARQSLGLPDDAVLILSVASEYKYSTGTSIPFLEVLEPIIARYPHAYCLVVGPRPDGVWLKAARSTANRLRAVGLQPDVDVYYHAADIYVDSFPTNSLTSALEAGAHGLPVVTCSPYHGTSLLLASDDPGLQLGRLWVDTPNALAEAIRGLVADVAKRRALGGTVKHEITALHAGDGWTEMLARVYELGASNRTARDSSVSVHVPSRSLEEIDYALVAQHIKSGRSLTIDTTVRRLLAHLPASTRPHIWTALQAVNRAVINAHFRTR